jgi:hypothetical protein
MEKHVPQEKRDPKKPLWLHLADWVPIPREFIYLSEY